MKTISLSVPDDVYRAVRDRATRQDLTISDLVVEYLRSLAPADAEFDRLEAQQQQIQAEIRRFRAVDRSTRGEVHQRGPR